MNLGKETVSVVSAGRSHPFVTALPEGRPGCWWVAVAGTVSAQRFVALCGLLKASGFGLVLQMGIGREFLLVRIVSSIQFDCSPASGCEGTTGVGESEGGLALCGLWMEQPAGVEISQARSAAEASLLSSRGTLLSFTRKHLVQENKLCLSGDFLVG